MNAFVCLLLSTVLAGPLLTRYPEILITDFEATPGYLGGKPEIWGAAYPHSSYMTLYSADFNPRYVHTGSTSYKLIDRIF